jgi:hypothetical protein
VRIAPESSGKLLPPSQQPGRLPLGRKRQVEDKRVIHIWCIACNIDQDISRAKAQATCNRKEAWGALAGSTVTPVMSTPDENLNSKPVKPSGHGDVVGVLVV